MIQSNLLIGGEWVQGTKRDILSPFTGEKVGSVEEGKAQQIEVALTVAEKCHLVFRKSSRYSRSRLLGLISDRIEKRREQLVASLVQEAGKPVAASNVEINRAVSTFRVASEEAKRLGGEVIPMDLDAGTKTLAPAVSLWFGKGPLLAICPFNFPLNLVAHKVAPALAVGIPVILKPAPQTPGASQILGEIFLESLSHLNDLAGEIPKECFQIVNCSNDLAEKMVKDSRIPIVSFTGSAKVGWHLQSQAIGKKLILELGGNAAVIIDKDANIEKAAKRCAVGGFTYSGQTCISVQRIYIHEDKYKEFSSLFIKEVQNLKMGDPANSDTVIGPLIDQKAIQRLTQWIDEAKKSGAEVLLEGKSEKSMLSPVILAQVKPESKIVSEEAFGPVAVIDKFKTFAEALNLVNKSKYGLQAGVFTNNLQNVNLASRDLEVGGLMINEVPAFRSDHMPYGGIKESGLGREGVKYTMEEYCERKLVVTF